MSGVMVTLDVDCAGCGALVATITMEEHRVGPELDGREFFCPRCQYGGLPTSREVEA